MIFYPIQTLVDAGVEEILIVTGGQNAGDFLRLLSNGKDFGLKHLNYAYQEGEGGIADALHDGAEPRRSPARDGNFPDRAATLETNPFSVWREERHSPSSFHKPWLERVERLHAKSDGVALRDRVGDRPPIRRNCRWTVQRAAVELTMRRVVKRQSQTRRGTSCCACIA